ncbi:MAG: conjugal transfer protein TraB [Sphingomonadales bacterium]|nr:conjugal transfer protein TraB [Sphingomonadales bacterium]NCO50155.1 conjugal transfer protein TraB [Sphingomonadales bacterium]NCP01041.1 conjugal transfer protein TraB [Sphingomonadales bacterium]NCP26372.1 conjugal transfer protein TraB [Sphingomonadales bacterium]NCP43530.1 conjugal transfer protein TraB [Sphingomonadales bacterium]
MSEEKQASETSSKDAETSHGNAHGDINQQIKKRQKLVLIGLGSAVLLGGSAFMFLGGDDSDADNGDGPVTFDATSLVNRNLSQKEFVGTYGNRLNAVVKDQKELREQLIPQGEIREELDALRQENIQMRADGQVAIDAISAENAALKGELAQAANTPPPSSTLPAYGPQAGDYDRQAGSLGNPDGAANDAPAPGAVKVLSFGNSNPAGKKTSTSKSDTSTLLLEDSPDYLPPNSYAPARVIVGVDASVGVASQSDPLPVVLRITGPARSVIKNGKLLTTNITGCVVNGAARGDLSAEKVYVKLARMTCAQPGGRVAVSEVKGFLSFAGKSGVRGRVVSREGNLVSQALLAGIVGGFGRGFSANAGGIFTGQIGADGKRDSLSGADILTGGLGQGAGDAADTVSKYLIERAEQYQPVVEMPTGIDVEIVFLDGVHVRRRSK